MGSGNPPNRISIWIGKLWKSFTFRALDATTLHEWVQAIFLNIDKNKPSALPDKHPSLFMIDEFWRYKTILHSAVLGKADTADLLLFSGNRFACKVQRFLTRSRFGIFFCQMRDPKFIDVKAKILQRNDRSCGNAASISGWKAIFARGYKW